MDWKQVFVLAVLAAVVTLYITRWLPIAVTSLLVPPVLFASGILDVKGALSGFANAATITIACMFVLSAGLYRTGALDVLTELLKKHARGSPLRLLILLALTVPFISAVMNNIPVAAMLLPVVLALARDMGVKPSRLLIPMSYFAILGGTTTLIGTGTNILVDDFYRQSQAAAGEPATGLGMFSFTGLGLVLLAVGVAYVLLVHRRLLPDRTSASALLPTQRSAVFLTEILIDKDTPLRGQAVRDVFSSSPLRLVELVRKEQVLFGPEAEDAILQARDTLVIEGKPKETAEFLEQMQAKIRTGGKRVDLPEVRSSELRFGEAVVLPDSRFCGRRLGGLAFHARYGVKVLSIQRGGEQRQKTLRNTILQAGDVMLVQASDTGFAALRDTEGVLIVEGMDQAIRRQKRVWVAIAIMTSVVFGAGLTGFPIVIFAVAGAALMVGTRCLRIDEATRSLDVNVLLLLIGTIPLGVALGDSTHATRDFVSTLIRAVGEMSPAVVLSVLYLLTSVITEFLSNKATAILLAPVAIQLAGQLNVSELPFLFAICFAASASFMTPFGYPTNLIVMGPGGYKFSDYLRIGIPLNLIIWIIASLLIPVIWPF